MEVLFDHEKLRVYQEAIAFINWWQSFGSDIREKAAARDQIERASTSIALNIAEGNGKCSLRDRCRYFDIARGSTLECAACLDVLLAKGLIDRADALEGKRRLSGIVAMLMGLMQSLSDRVGEAFSSYDAFSTGEREQEREREGGLS